MWVRRLGILLLALSFAGAATLPVSAQSTADRNVDTRTADDGFDLGWLGLVGLVGLLGLRRRDDAHSHLKGASR
jgi:MYXO-CTERM domain-containing protein